MSGEAYGQGHNIPPIGIGIVIVFVVVVILAAGIGSILTTGSSGGSADPPAQVDPVKPVEPVAPVDDKQSEAEMTETEKRKAVINDYFSPQDIPEVIRYDSSRSNEGVVVENLYITDVRINDNANNENTNIMTFWVRNGDQDKAQFLSGISVTCRFERGGYQYWAIHPYKKGEKMKNCELGIGPGEKIMFMVEIDDIAMTGNLESFHIGVAPLYAIPMDALKV